MAEASSDKNISAAWIRAHRVNSRGSKLATYKALPEGTPRAAIVIAHGYADYGVFDRRPEDICVDVRGEFI